MNLKEKVEELKRDLLNPNGPQISTMNNYSFAILQYEPAEEFLMRELINELVNEMRQYGWKVKNVDLFDLMIKRLKSENDEETIKEIIDGEKRLFKRKGITRSLKYLEQTMVGDLEGAEGIASDVIKEIELLVGDSDPSQTLIFISRAGAIYPFYRTSGLLRYLDGKTSNVPVILLYPGSRPGVTSLSFMDEHQPDSDYRPRIY
jgi:hypothetical protein